ncbi:MAG: hypothetical protein HYV29_07395 [Ignavibacteriales bacterium]|nr:hypothetical protein [Ignavibacteriales bacterium]
MEKPKHSIQFEAEVDKEGKVTFSKIVDDLKLKPGSKVTVNIFGGVISERLTQLGVTEKEIERIGNTQLEDREHVMIFLASQGILKKRPLKLRSVRA